MNHVKPRPSLPGYVHAGIGSIARLPDILSEYRAGRILLVSDAGVVRAGLVSPVEEALHKQGIRFVTCFDIPPEPTVDEVETAFARVSDTVCDAVVGIGGGSVLDSAKLLSVLFANRMPLSDMVGTHRIPRAGLPLILIPTTSGTGSEATPNAIVTLPESSIKAGIVSPFLTAGCVLLDPALTVGLPARLTASTGMDALAHALESLLSKKADQRSRHFSIEALSLIGAGLRCAFVNGDDLRARENLLNGSFRAGMAIACAGTTAVHAMAYPLGGRFHIPHGTANAMLLAPVFDFMRPSAGAAMKEAAVAMGLCDDGVPEEVGAECLVGELWALSRALHIPAHLADFGVTAEDLPSLAAAAAGITRLMENNPCIITIQDMTRLYGRIL